MNENRIKNYLIVALSICTVFLTGQLWFEKLANTSFINSVFSKNSSQANSVSRPSNFILEPFRIVTSFGDGNFSANYNELDSLPEKILTDKIIAKMLSGGQFSQEVEKIDLLSTFTMYEYKFPVPTNFFSEIYGGKTLNLSAKMKNFDSIAIQLSTKNDDVINVFFVNHDLNKTYLYTVSDADLAEGLKTLQPKTNDTIFYKSSEIYGFDMFERNNFIPAWSGKKMDYIPILQENPYAPKGDLSIPTIETKVEYLFETSEMRFSGIKANIYTFSNENIVVKYYPNNILEYSNYKQSEEKLSLSESYFVAIDFLRRDKTISNEIFLSKIEQDETDYVFYFDYNVNNFPLMFSDVSEDEIQMTSPIKITVSGDQVKKYKKIVYNFKKDSSVTEFASETFKNLLETIVPGGENDKNIKVDEVFLAYKVDQGKKTLKLHWFMKMDGKTYINPSQFK